MADIARAAQNNSPGGVGALPAAVAVMSSYTEALDTVRLSYVRVLCADRLDILGATSRDFPRDC